MKWRVVIVSQIIPVALGFREALLELGHEPVAFMALLDRKKRWEMDLRDIPDDLDIISPARRRSIAPLLRAVEPDLVVCMAFPWKIPADALAVPEQGWVNGHPSLLPRHRGPTPVAWAIRHGDAEMGITFHRMDAELDTGPILAQTPIPLGDPVAPDDFYPQMAPIVVETLKTALQRVAAGEEGEQQTEGGEYETFFTSEDAWLDLSRPSAELHQLVWAWRYGMILDGPKGALLELDGTPTRVLATSLTEADGATRVECGDGPLWIVETEELTGADLSAGGAKQSSAPAEPTQ